MRTTREARRSSLRPAQEQRQLAQPVAGGRQHHVAHTDRRQSLRDAFPVRGCGGREAAAEVCAARVDAQLPSRLGINEPELAGVGELLLPRVANLDGDDIVAAGELEERPAPVLGAAEVRDEDDEGALAREGVR